MSPVFVCTFQDNETVRLSCWHDKGCANLDHLRRGLKLARSAYITRMCNRARSTSVADDDVEIPPVTAAHFEDADGVVLASYDVLEITEAASPTARRSQGRHSLSHLKNGDTYD